MFTVIDSITRGTPAFSPGAPLQSEMDFNYVSMHMITCRDLGSGILNICMLYNQLL